MADGSDIDRDRLERHLEHECAKRGLTRAELMKGGAGAAAAVGLGWLVAACGGGDDETAEPASKQPGTEPSGAAPVFAGTLRVTGLGVDLIDPIKEMAEADLGFTLAFDVTDTVTMVQRAVSQPGSFDVFSGYAYQYDQIWPSGNMHPIEIARIPAWSQMTPLMTQGLIDPTSATCSRGDGDAVFRKLYVDPEASGRWPSSPETPEELQGVMVQWVDESTGQTVGEEPGHTIGPPGHIFNMDAMGYDADAIPKEADQVDWSELLNASYKGRVAILNDPGIGFQDTGAAARALGLMQFQSLGNMTKDEIDGLVDLLIDYKRKGQFRAFWTTFDEAVNLMAAGEVVIESAWSPVVALLVAQGKNARYAAPPSGFRGWCANHGISAEAAKDPALLQACYDYINWWYNGKGAALMMRQGYYNAVVESARAYVEPEEWDYWIEGKPAAKDLPGITGQVGDIKQGQVRDGGALAERACNYLVWNSYFTENEYQVQRWNEFLSA